MNKTAFVKTLLTVSVVSSLSACTMNSATEDGARPNRDSTKSQQVDNSLKDVNQTFTKAEKSIDQSMKNLGPSLSKAETQIDNSVKGMGPGLNKAEQEMKTVGKGIGKTGAEIGNSIDDTATDMRSSMNAKKTAGPTHAHEKTAR